MRSRRRSSNGETGTGSGPSWPASPLPEKLVNLGGRRLPEETMRKLTITVALLVLTLVSAVAGYGQTRHRSFELTGYGGIRIYDKDVVFMDSGWVAGGKLAWFPHANIGVEGTVSFSKAKVTFEELADPDDE